MRKFVPVSLITAVLVLAAVGQTPAQDTRLKSASAEFRSFYSKFIAAVHRGDKVAVASMTSFPVIYGFDAGDEGKATRKEFMNSLFRRMFGKAPRNFLIDRDPIISGDGTSYTVSTKDATHLMFTKGGKRFFFTDYLVEP